MADRHYSLPGVLGDIQKLVDAGETLQGKKLTVPESISHRPKTISSGRKMIANAGTAVALSATSKPLFVGVVVKARASNTATIYVGPSGVLTTDADNNPGYPLEPGEAISYSVADLNAIFINGALGNGVTWTGN